MNKFLFAVISFSLISGFSMSAHAQLAQQAAPRQNVPSSQRQLPSGTNVDGSVERSVREMRAEIAVLVKMVQQLQTQLAEVPADAKMAARLAGASGGHGAQLINWMNDLCQGSCSRAGANLKSSSSCTIK